MGSGTARALVLGLAVVLLVLFAWHSAAVRRGAGFLRWDDSHYLTRGLYHARQVEARGDLFLPRLVYSLSFESPKPPLMVGWVALGRGLGLDFEGLLVYSSTLPALLLTLGMTAAGWRYGGPIAGLFAAAAAWGSPQLYAMSFELMVETFLACGFLVFCACLSLATLPGRRIVEAIAAGLAGAFCILTKLSAVPFVAVAVGATAFLVARRMGSREAAVRAGVAGVTVLALVGPWFARNGQAAFRYFRDSANWTEVVGARVTPADERAVSLLLQGLGIPVSALLLGAAAAALFVRGRREINLELEGFVAAAGSGAAVLAAGLMSAPYFEARYFAPAAPALAVAGAALLACSGTGYRWALAGGVTAGLALSMATGRGLRPPERTADVRRAIPAVRAVFESGQRRVVVAGSGPDWNGFKLAAAAELAGLGSRIEFTDVAGMPANLGMEKARGGDWIVVCDVPEEKLAAEPRANRPYRPIRSWLEGGVSGFARIETIDLPRGLALYRRLAEAPEASTGPGTEQRKGRT